MKPKIKDIGMAISYLVGIAIVWAVISGLLYIPTTREDKVVAILCTGFIMTGFFIVLGKVRKK